MLPDFRRTLRIARNRVTSVLGARELRRLGITGDAPISVFFYHRIANQHVTEWSMSASQFEHQIDYLCNRCEVIGLDEVQRRIRTRQSYRAAAAITFDDGYADNNDFALPLLVKRRLPCTYFVSLENVLYGKSFPHDIKAGFHFKPNTIEELRYWAKSGIEIGLHTRTHHDFSASACQETIEAEIVTAKTELECLIGQPIRYFAFPYGLPQQLSPAAIAAVARCGMSGFCSAFGAYNIPGRDEFHIRRIHGDVENERFENWLNFDRRKLRLEPKIEYNLKDVVLDDYHHTPNQESTSCPAV